MLALRISLQIQGICLIEWPDKAAGTLPSPDIIFQLSYLNEKQRTVKILPNSKNGQILIESLIPS
jgi:tRNA threonylcarbamoyladenosine biosynthesis protein TsaE